MNMAVTGGTTTTSSFSLTKIVGFPPPPSPSRSCSMILGVKEGQERWGGGNGMAVKARFGSSKGGAGVLERPKFDQSQFDPATQLEQGTYFIIYPSTVLIFLIWDFSFVFNS